MTELMKVYSILVTLNNATYLLYITYHILCACNCNSLFLYEDRFW
jgi:hypothetical protein